MHGKKTRKKRIAPIQAALGLGASLFLTTLGCASDQKHKCGEIPFSFGYGHACGQKPHLYCLQRKYDLGDTARMDELIGSSQVKKTIELCKKEELHCIAAGLEEKITIVDDAVTDYIKAKQYENAARLIEMKGNEELAKQYYEKAYIQYSTGIDVCHSCSLDIAEKLKDKVKIQVSKRNLMLIEEKCSNYDRAAELAIELNDLNIAVRNLEKAGFRERAAEICKQMGDLERAIANYEKTTLCENEIRTLSLKVAEESKKCQNFDKTINYYKKAIKAGDSATKSTLARLAHGIKKYSLAIEYYKKSGEYDKELKIKLYSQGTAYSNLLVEQGRFYESYDIAMQVENVELAEKIRNFSIFFEKTLLQKIPKMNSEDSNDAKEYAEYLRGQIDLMK